MLMKWKLRLNFQTIDPSRGGFHEGSSWQKFDHNTSSNVRGLIHPFYAHN